MSATPHTLRELDDRVREVLGRRELVSADEVRKARLRQRTDDRSLGELLVESGALDPCDLRTILSEMLDLPAVDLRHTPCDPTALDVLPAAKAWELGAIPLFVVEGEATVAISDPTDLAALDELRFATGKKILPVLALESDIQDHLRAYYGDRAEDDADLLEFVQADGSSVDDTVALDHVEVDRPVVRVVSLILVRAIQEEASDIHFEPQDGGMTVRFRLDGRLQPKPFRIPASAIGSIVSRIKILSSLDISEKRRPQDGKIRLTYRGRKIDVRTSTCPTFSP